MGGEGGRGSSSVFGFNVVPQYGQATKSAEILFPQDGHFGFNVVPQYGQATKSAEILFPQDGHLDVDA